MFDMTVPELIVYIKNMTISQWFSAMVLAYPILVAITPPDTWLARALDVIYNLLTQLKKIDIRKLKKKK